MIYYRSTSSLKSDSKQLGFSLVESMVAILLALFLTAGLLSVFISSKRATDQSIDSGERQENAHFALQLLTKDLKQAYFFSHATGENKDLWNLNGASINASDDCLDDISSGSFPTSAPLLYRPLWADSIPSSGSVTMDCLNDSDTDTSLVADSDYISIKRVRGFQQDADYNSDRFYLDISTSSVTVYEGDASALTTTVAADLVSPVWEYIHHVYYLDTLDDVSRLRRLTLEGGAMKLEEVLVEGVESMQFMFALDEQLASDRDGSVHSFVGTSGVSSSDWSSGRVIGMKVFLLIRSLEPTPGYTNSSTYQMGDYQFPAANDNYKRELVSTVILFPNSVVSVDD